MQELHSWVGCGLWVCNGRSAERKLWKGKSHFLFAHFHRTVALTPYQGSVAMERSAEGVGPPNRLGLDQRQPCLQCEALDKPGMGFSLTSHMCCLTLVLYAHRHLHGLFHSGFEGEDTEGSCLL